MQSMTEQQLGIAKLRVSIIAGLVGAVSLLVGFLSFLATVDRDRVDRTFQLMETGDGHLYAARSEFQTVLRLMAEYPVRLQTEGDRAVFYDGFLKSYRGADGAQQRGAAAWELVLPLGDYFERLLLCTEENACSKNIYCTMIESELLTFASVTRTFRQTAVNQSRTFAKPLDDAEHRVVCG
jgi:hypothetical protein